MQCSELQKLVIANAHRYAKKHQISLDRDFLLLKLMEEMGEFSEAVLVSKGCCRAEKRVSDEKAKQQMAHELVDIISTSLLLADDFHIDLFAAFEEKILVKARVYLAQNGEKDLV